MLTLQVKKWTKKATNKKKCGEIAPSASKEQPTEPPVKEKSGELAPDVTQQPVNEEVVLIANGTQDKGTRNCPPYSLLLDVVEELYDVGFPTYKVPVVAPFCH